MILADFISVVKQKIGQAVAEINGEYPEYLTEFILEIARTVNFWLIANGVATNITIDSTAKTITPTTFNDNIGLLLAYGTASDIVNESLVQKLRSGELGLSFRTAVSQISTNQAAMHLTGVAKVLAREFDHLLTRYLSTDPESINERLQ